VYGVFTMTSTSPPAARRGEDVRRRGLLIASDWLQSLDHAAKTAGVIGAVLLAYCLIHGAWVAACDINGFLYHLGAVLAAAANGA